MTPPTWIAPPTLSCPVENRAATDLEKTELTKAAKQAGKEAAKERQQDTNQQKKSTSPVESPAAGGAPESVNECGAMR